MLSPTQLGDIYFTFIILLAVFCVGFIVYYIAKIYSYLNSTYYKTTHLSYFSVIADKGRTGEYNIYKKLKRFEFDGAKILFNVYIPKENGKTTEIDVLMISRKGLFVFESKNYSGWIHGSDDKTYWYQTLPVGRRRKSHKEKFYNPVMQNRTHVKSLSAFLNGFNFNLPMQSIIVFSDNCELKNVSLFNNDTVVINFKNMLSIVSAMCERTPVDLLSNEDVNNVYNILYPYTQVSEGVKAAHIYNIQQNTEMYKTKYKNKNYRNKTTYAAQSSIYTPYVKATAQFQPTVCGITTEKAETEYEDSPIAEINKENTENVISGRLNDSGKACADILPESKAETAIQITNTADEIKEPIREVSESSVESDNIINDKQELKCPFCGGRLVLRVASKGKNVGNSFYGCSNYPKCKYTRSLVKSENSCEISK